MADEARTPRLLPALVLGIGLGGFVDGILLHQVLQWHHMLTSEGCCSSSTVAGLEDNTLADGLFHVAAWVAVVAGTAAPTPGPHRGGRAPPRGGLALAEDGRPATDPGRPPLDRDAGRLRDALDRLDAPGANAALDRLLASFLLDTVLAGGVFPYLRDPRRRR